MKYKHVKRGIVMLADGTVFEGGAAGAVGTATGEVCFNTGMTGYQEIFTDPSYYGQIITMASPHIGNYGTAEADMESNQTKISGMICKKFSEGFSRPAADLSLNDFLVRDKVVAITDVDTRSLVKHIRDNGAMNAIISTEEFDLDVLRSKLSEVPSMNGLELASKVSTKESYEEGSPDAAYRVALIDLGTKKNIVRSLVERNCLVHVFPYDVGTQELMDWKPNGVMLSNGPGDPQPLTSTIDNVKKLLEMEMPIFGICLGHQVLALANDLSTFKMHNGHRGINHPVKNLSTGHCEVTSQNHGFVVNREEAEKSEHIEMTHVHLNDDTLAGLRVKNRPAFSVQYHPEASPGPWDSKYLFDDFITLMQDKK